MNIFSKKDMPHLEKKINYHDRFSVSSDADLLAKVYQNYSPRVARYIVKRIKKSSSKQEEHTISPIV